MSAISEALYDPFVEWICPLLTYGELANKVSLVCMKWKEWADCLWTPEALSELNVRIFSRKEIEEALPPEIFLRVSFDMIPETIDFKKALIKASRFYADIKAAGTAVEGDKGLTIVPRPQGLTLNMLYAVYRNRLRLLWGDTLRELGNEKSEGGQFMITSNILEKTRDKTFDEQQSLCQKAGGALPGVVDAVFYALIKEQIDSIRPFDDDSGTYTRCIEKINQSLFEASPIVGTFLPAGLYFDHLCEDDEEDDTGACALQKY